MNRAHVTNQLIGKERQLYQLWEESWFLRRLFGVLLMLPRDKYYFKASYSKYRALGLYENIQ